MVVFLNEDRAYVSWVIHHRQGFVLDGKRKPNLGHLILHRATCPEIKAAASKHPHWTTGAKLKACSLDRMELEAWTQEESNAPPVYCQSCQPQKESARNEVDPAHLSRLAREILEYVLDAAIIHFDEEMPAYHLTVGDIATCFGKTPGQVSAALHQLVNDGFITIPGKIGPESPMPAKRIVLPTIVAIRTIEAYHGESDSTILQELAKLQSA